MGYATGWFGCGGGEEGNGGVGTEHGFSGEGFDGGELGGTGFVGGRGEELDVDVCVLFDGVFGGDGADGFGYGEDELVGFFCGGVVQFGSMLWVCGFDD